MFGVEELVILDDKNHLRLLHMWAARRASHSCPKITFARSRSYAWIIHGFRLTGGVCNSCPDSLLDEDYTRQRTYCDILFQTWWSNWYTQVLDNLIPYQSYGYCRATSASRQGGIARTMVIKQGIRRKVTKFKEMKVGVQRQVLVTPKEKINEKLKRNYRLEKEEEETADIVGSNELSKELRGLKVPEWMQPTSDKRGRVNLVISYSAIQGLSLGLADTTA